MHYNRRKLVAVSDFNNNNNSETQRGTWKNYYVLLFLFFHRNVTNYFIKIIWIIILLFGRHWIVIWLKHCLWSNPVIQLFLPGLRQRSAQTKSHTNVTIFDREYLPALVTSNFTFKDRSAQRQQLQHCCKKTYAASLNWICGIIFDQQIKHKFITFIH